MSQATKDWKHKYLDSLDELERKEESWKHVEGVLRKAISRLTLIATDSQHDNLNNKLAELRIAIRDEKDTDSLQFVVDEVSELIQRMGEQEPDIEKENIKSHDILIELLEMFEFPQGAKVQV